MIGSYAPDPVALVVGATGGLGRAFADHLESAGATVHRASRSGGSGAGELKIDYDDPASIPAALEPIETLDIVIVATGLLHAGEAGPEKSIRALDADWMERNYRINAVGPLLVAQAALPKLRRDTKTVFAALSARIGSISDNRIGGWHSYRMAKAALNQGLRTVSIEHARRWPDSVVAGLHPGTVDTGLSKPFQKAVPEGKLFEADWSAGEMLKVLDGLKPSDTGNVFDYAGEQVPA